MAMHRPQVIQFPLMAISLFDYGFPVDTCMIFFRNVELGFL